MKTFITIALAAICGLGYSQNTNLRNDQNLAGQGMIFGKSELGAPPTGSQYFDENYHPAQISGGGVMALRYNAYTDQLEYMEDNQLRSVMPELNMIVKPSDGSYPYVFTEYVGEKGKTMGYLVFLEDNPKVKLYAKQRVLLQKESQPSNGYANYRPANYKKMPVKYYISKNDGAIVELPVKKKKLVALFPNNEADIAAFLNSNKLDDESEMDMVKLAKFLDSL